MMQMAVFQRRCERLAATPGGYRLVTGSIPGASTVLTFTQAGLVWLGASVVYSNMDHHATRKNGFSRKIVETLGSNAS